MGILAPYKTKYSVLYYFVVLILAILKPSVMSFLDVGLISLYFIAGKMSVNFAGLASAPSTPSSGRYSSLSPMVRKNYALLS